MSEKKLAIIYGTGNPAKLNVMRRRLEPLNIEVLGLKDIDLPIPEIDEDGCTPLENAEKKARAYYQAFRMPVFSCDSGMYFDNVPDEDQPGVHVRTVNGKYLTDEEMIEHYTGLAGRYPNLTARYRNAICLVMDENHVYKAMDKTMESEPFIIATIPYPIRKEGFPLDSLSIHIKTGKYYCDLLEEELDKVAVEDGFLAFFQRILGLV